MQAIYNLTNPHTSNGHSCSDVYMGDGTTVYFDYNGSALTSAIINSVRFVWYGHATNKGGTGTVTMNGGTMSLPFAYTGKNRQECAVIASGASLDCFAGTSGTLSIALSMNNSYICFRWARLEVDYTPNTSTLTLSSATVDAGGSITATITPYDSSYTHTLGLYFGSQETWWTLEAGVTEQTVTVPMAYLNQMTNTSTGTATLKLYTLSGGTVIGSTTQTLTITAGADSAPTFTASCTPALTVDGVTYPDVSQGGYVRTKCGVQAKIEGVAGQYGANVTNTQISVLTYTAQGTSDLTLNSGLLYQSGTVNVVLSATDSRGMTTTKTITLNVLAYNAPKLTSLSVNRCDAEGTADAMGDYGAYAVSWTYSSLNGKNVPTATLSVRKKGTEDTPAALTSNASSGSSGVLSDASGAYALNQAYAWETILTITDGYGSVSFSGVVASAQFVRTVNRTLNAVAYGKTAEHADSFEIAPTLEMYVHGQTLPDYVGEHAPVQSVNGQTGAVTLTIPSTPTMYTAETAWNQSFTSSADSFNNIVSMTVPETGLYLISMCYSGDTAFSSRAFIDTGDNNRSQFPLGDSFPTAEVTAIRNLTKDSTLNGRVYSYAAGTYAYQFARLTAVLLAKT